MKIQNKQVLHEYRVLEKIECGIVLRGNEVKSIRAGKANLKGSWCTIQNNELVLRGLHISAWGTSNKFDIDEDRERKLLVHKKEINKLIGLLKTEGITLIPIEIYFNKQNKCKVLMGVCKGLKTYDKRENLKKKQVAKDIERALKNNNKGEY